MLELRGASKQYGPHVALHPTNLRIEQGQVHGLLGTSGSGKSTILRLMVGLLWPEKGQVLFQGEPLTQDRLRAARVQMGYVIQEGGLFPHMTAHQNLSLQARHLGRTPEQIEARIHELTSLVQLPARALHQYPQELSGGQRQRVGLMRALMLDPAVLLLDEPLGALDPMIRAELQGDLKQIFSSLKKTVLLVTHDVQEALFLCDVITLMNEGRVVQQGAHKDFIERPASPFVTRFFHAQRGLS